MVSFYDYLTDYFVVDGFWYTDNKIIFRYNCNYLIIVNRIVRVSFTFPNIEIYKFNNTIIIEFDCFSIDGSVPSI